MGSRVVWYKFTDVSEQHAASCCPANGGSAFLRKRNLVTLPTELFHLPQDELYLP